MKDITLRIVCEANGEWFSVYHCDKERPVMFLSRRTAETFRAAACNVRLVCPVCGDNAYVAIQDIAEKICELQPPEYQVDFVAVGFGKHIFG